MFRDKSGVPSTLRIAIGVALTFIVCIIMSTMAPYIVGGVDTSLFSWVVHVVWVTLFSLMMIGEGRDRQSHSYHVGMGVAMGIVGLAVCAVDMRDFHQSDGAILILLMHFVVSTSYFTFVSYMSDKLYERKKRFGFAY